MGVAGLSEVGQRRLVRVAVSSFATGMAISGVMVILPLYATRTLHLSNAAFARVLSLRMIGITAGVVLLGAISDRFGTRRLTVFSLAAGGISLGMLGFVPLTFFLILVPVMSAFLSTAFVNLNHLTQIVDVRKQGMANTLYRATGTGAGILSPLIMTRLMEHIGIVLAMAGAGMVASAVHMRSYPLDESHEPFQGWLAEFRTMGAMYRKALAQRHLMGFIHLSLFWGALTTVVGTFAAIRLTNELGATAAYYGNACAIGSAVTLAGILALGAALDRMSIKRCTMALFLVASLCTVALGVLDSAHGTAVAFVVFSVVTGASIGPLSIWISRESGDIGLSLAFGVHKVLNAAYLAVATLLLGFLEPVLGIRNLFLCCGVASLAALAALLCLRAPPALMAGKDPLTTAGWLSRESRVPAGSTCGCPDR